MITETSDNFDTFDVERVRADFPILSSVRPDGKSLVYLDNAATTQRPRQVIDSVVDVYASRYANVHRGIHWLSDQTTDLFEEAREKIRDFINAEAREEVIFTHGTTESINLVAHSWGQANVKAGDEILLTEMEHHSNIVPWQQLAERTGASIRWAPITDDGLLDFKEFDRLLTKRTKLVAVAAVSNVLGTINPIEEICAAGTRGRRCGVGRCRPACAAFADRRALDGRGFCGVQRAQDARADRGGDFVGPARTVGCDAAVSGGRQHDSASAHRRL